MLTKNKNTNYTKTATSADAHRTACHGNIPAEDNEETRIPLPSALQTTK